MSLIWKGLGERADGNSDEVSDLFGWLGRRVLNVERSGLLTICIYSHARSTRNLTTKFCYTLHHRMLSHDH